MTGAMRCITRRWTDSCANARRRKSAAAISADAAALRDHPNAELALGQHGDRTDPGRRHLVADRLDAVADGDLREQRALEQQVDAADSLALIGDDLARPGHRARDTSGIQSASVGVVEIVEQVEPAQLGQRDLGAGHGSSRYWWISETAIEPSPTALATRLIERARTSPATNTPGTLVSSRNGSRGSGQPRPRPRDPTG